MSTGRKLRGKRVAILTSTGGAGTLVSDSLGVAGFDTPAPDPETAAALRALQTGSHAALDRNPIDVTLAGLQPDLLRGAIKTLLASPTYDALTIIVGSSGLATPELMADAIQRLPAAVGQAGHRLREPARAGGRRRADQRGRSRVHRRRKLHRRARRHAAGRPAASPAMHSAAQESEVAIDDFPAGSLDEAQAKALFARFGVPVAREQIVNHAGRSEGGGRGAGRARGAQDPLRRDHAQERRGRRGRQSHDRTTVGARLVAMAQGSRVQDRRAPAALPGSGDGAGGTELILGMHRDPLGTAILLGMGGVTAELFKDTTMRLLPPNGASRTMRRLGMARELITWPLLDGFRGRRRRTSTRSLTRSSRSRG